jgi:NhaP-type Na+/H+ and K+/H+ antiporter
MGIGIIKYLIIGGQCLKKGIGGIKFENNRLSRVISKQ